MAASAVDRTCAAASFRLPLALLTDAVLFRSVHAPDGGTFFERNFLLYLSTEDLGRAEPLIRALAGDPSMRGVLDALTLSLKGVALGRISLDDLSRP